MTVVRYLLGVTEVALLGAAAAAAATRLRARLLPRFSGAPAHLVTAVLALALLIWSAVALGTVGLFKPTPYLMVVVAFGFGIWVVGRRWHSHGETPREENGLGQEKRTVPPGESITTEPAASASRGIGVATVAALLIAAVAVVHFAAGVRVRLSTGMTGFDSTWYHGPFAAGFFQSGDTWRLHFIAPQFLAWFYPANGEIFHAVGMLAFGRDILSPLINIGWFAGCLAAAWCIGRPYRVAPASLALAAAALSIPALADQAGEARNDLAATFFLLAAVAIALNGARERMAAPVASRLPSSTGDLQLAADGLSPAIYHLSPAVFALAGLAAGLAAGTKLNLLIPVAAFVTGLAVMAPRRARLRAVAITGLAALAGGGYWYLRNLAHTGNPLPWFGKLGPIDLPAPEQPLGGREGHSVISYLTNGSVWSSWFLPGLHDGLGLLWPLLLAAAVLGLLLALGRGSDGLLRLSGIVGGAAIVAWAVAPTSASGPEGMPHGFVSGLRYLAPALVLGLAILPATPWLRRRVAAVCVHTVHPRPWRVSRTAAALAALLVLLVAVVVGYPVQRHYLDNRYANPEFSAPGLDAAFKWARSVSGARIGTTSTRQYPLFGTDLSNHVQFVGIPQPHGGFVVPPSCRVWRQALNTGGYDYVVVSRDRVEPSKPAYPPTVHWTEGPNARVVLRKPPTVVFKLNGPLPPSTCR
jgi:hypothetical protein